jgi:hypothetical protein
VKRYGDITKEFQIEEFIPNLIARHHLPSMDDIRTQLDRIEDRTVAISDTAEVLRQIGEIVMQTGESK